MSEQDLERFESIIRVAMLRRRAEWRQEHGLSEENSHLPDRASIDREASIVMKHSMSLRHSHHMHAFYTAHEQSQLRSILKWSAHPLYVSFRQKYDRRI